MNWNVLAAIFKRNFISYFSNPTGYVFICVFVALSSLAAFWPNEFFNANLANLDQLNKYLPLIMLAFIPAVTMSIWAEERRQGTDELLLTIPAGDMDVVLGKFLAALAIFSVALGFSMIANYLVLETLTTVDAHPDVGLFIGTYIGYWMVGMVMLSVGMVASFLTSNLTVGFVLGVIFNLPLVFSEYADAIFPGSELSRAVQSWSLSAQLSDFQRGVISIASIAYFVSITAVMLYLANVLIGRRHWAGGRKGINLAWHYFARTAALLVAAISLSYLLSNHDFLRQDITSAQLSSLSPDTKRLLKNLESEHPVVVEAFISPSVPPDYVQTRLNLLSVLDEIQAVAGDKVRVEKHIIERFSEAAQMAEEKYDIQPRTVISRARGTIKEEEIYLALALRCGLEKEVLPFIDRGLPAEYELARSIAVVATDKRPKLGVLKTDAQIFARFDPQTFRQMPEQAIVQELRKQYDVEEVDPAEPIDVWIPVDPEKPDGEQKLRYQSLIVVQPSSLPQPQLDNLIAAVKDGQPTALFEDPLPQFWANVPGTRQPRQPQQSMNMFQRPPPPEPKGDITQLWDLLGIDMVGDEIVCQNYNPYPKAKSFFTPEFVFVDQGTGVKRPFGEDNPISSGLQQVLFLFPGSFIVPEDGKLEVDKLARTGTLSGTISYDALTQGMRGGNRTQLENARDWTNKSYTLAVRVHGPLPEESDGASSLGSVDEQSAAALSAARLARISDDLCQAEADADDTSAEAEPVKPGRTSTEEEDAAEGAVSAARGELNVVLVADIDFLISGIFQIRAEGDNEDALVNLQLDNVPFILNIVDYLAGDERFLAIRKRRRPHRTLKAIDDRMESSREEAEEERENFREEFEKSIAAEERKFQERLREIEESEALSSTEKRQAMETLQSNGRRAIAVKREKLAQDRDREVQQIEQRLERELREVQMGYKLKALLLPPILPLLLAFFVYFHRRHQEREGVAKTRLR